MQKEIIQAVDREILETELSKEKFLRTTNYGNNEIYVLTHHDSPNVMLEVGRLREVSFRMAGGGTGKAADIDAYDTDPVPYKQMVVWDPSEKEIIGGYRFILGHEVGNDAQGKPKLATSGLLEYSEKFIKDYLPFTIELGRSFVQPKYQPSKESRKGLFSLDNLWDGLGAMVVDYPHIKYFFGKVTMYDHFNPVARDLILYFMHRFFPDTEKLTWPKEPLPYKTDISTFESLFTGKTFEQNHKILFQKVRELGENIPPLVNSYMVISPSMKTFGTAWNEEFGGVEETGILIKIADIYENKTDRHINTYRKGE
ncbi:MAG: GNAT family N-acetyltransferase [Bacteroidetes bacterium]|nr:MAG: GNAT family N-acetyltransferase [Bacteroidota bacterium]